MTSRGVFPKNINILMQENIFCKFFQNVTNVGNFNSCVHFQAAVVFSINDEYGISSSFYNHAICNLSIDLKSMYLIWRTYFFIPIGGFWNISQKTNSEFLICEFLETNQNTFEKKK